MKKWDPNPKIDLNEVFTEAIRREEAESTLSTEQLRIGIGAISMALSEMAERTGKKPLEIIIDPEN